MSSFGHMSLPIGGMLLKTVQIKTFAFFFFPFLNPDKMATICRWLTVNYYRDKN